MGHLRRAVGDGELAGGRYRRRSTVETGNSGVGREPRVQQGELGPVSLGFVSHRGCAGAGLDQVDGVLSVCL